MELKDWTIEYVKAKNAVQRTLIDHTVSGDEITFMHKHKTHHFLISPELRVPQARDTYSVVCLQNQHNLDYLLAHWDSFVECGVSVLFVNPSVNLHWQINPRVHALVADPETLEQGVRSMAGEVPEV